LLQDIWHMDDRSGQDRCTGGGLAIWGPGEQRLYGGDYFRRAPMACRVIEHPSFSQEDKRKRRATEPGDAPHDRVEYWLYICWRGGDPSQDLACGSLLLQRLGHLRIGLCEGLVLLLQLLEQAHILDRDHRLVGEGLEKGDLPLREDLA